MKQLFKKIKKVIQTPNSYARDNGVKYGKNCLFYTKKFGSEPYLVSFGDNCEVSYNVDFITHDGAVWVLRNLYADLKNIDILKPIVIGDNVFIGANSTVLPGVTIGSNIIVASGSVVTKDLEDNSVYGGVPAKRISSLDEYKMKNEKYFVNTKNLSFVDKKEFVMKNILSKKT